MKGPFLQLIISKLFNSLCEAKRCPWCSYHARGLPLTVTEPGIYRGNTKVITSKKFLVTIMWLSGTIYSFHK